MKRFEFLLFVLLALFTCDVWAANPVALETELNMAEQEELMIIFSDVNEYPGHFGAYAEVVKINGDYPNPSYTYEWFAYPGGTGTTCSFTQILGREVFVNANYTTPGSSRIELECRVYLNGELQTTLYAYKYF